MTGAGPGVQWVMAVMILLAGMLLQLFGTAVADSAESAVECTDHRYFALNWDKVRYQKHPKLGSGKDSEGVYIAQVLLPGLENQHFALKIVKSEHEFNNELADFKNVRGPGVITIVGKVEPADPGLRHAKWAVLEPLASDSLRQYGHPLHLRLKNSGPNNRTMLWDESLLAQLDLLEGVDTLNQCGLDHRDFTLGNIATYNDPDGALRLALIDLSRLRNHSGDHGADNMKRAGRVISKMWGDFAHTLPDELRAPWKRIVRQMDLTQFRGCIRGIIGSDDPPAAHRCPPTVDEVKDALRGLLSDEAGRATYDQRRGQLPSLMEPALQYLTAAFSS